MMLMFPMPKPAWALLLLKPIGVTDGRKLVGDGGDGGVLYWIELFDEDGAVFKGIGRT